MGRPTRIDVGGYAYHVLNRANGRRIIFKKRDDFAAFERVLGEAVERSSGGVRLLAYCVMGNHWHLVVRTTENGVLSPFMKWLTLTHTQRYQVAHKRVGYGPIYQGRFKSFVIESESHLLTVCRYVERNALRAGLIASGGRAEDWRWSSLHRWRNPRPRKSAEDDDSGIVLSKWPIPGGRPKQWLRTVNRPLTQKELEAVRTCANRCAPFGSDRWRGRVVKRFGLESTLRKPGRPRKA